MRTLLPQILLAGVLVISGGPAALAEVPDHLARWLLAAPQLTEPLPLRPGRPTSRDGIITSRRVNNELGVRSQGGGLSRWSGEYAQEVAPSDSISRLPSVEDESSELRFAAGGIVCPVPPDWHVSQSDQLRHVRLYLTPEHMLNENKFDEGLWITYHARPASPSAAELSQFAQRRLRELLPTGTQVFTTRELSPFGLHSLQTPLRFESVDGTHQESTDGYHLVAAAEWGIVEIHARYRSQTRAREIAAIVDNLTVDRPAVVKQASLHSPAGAWKAERARLVLHPDQTVELQHDRERLQQIEQAKLVRPTRGLTGTYSVAGDVLQIIWQDGSQLNLRFQNAGHELLLTDHHGRISQLQRLFE